MTILIADSGSTKTDWRVIDAEGNIDQFKSPGINPYYLSPEEIAGRMPVDQLSAYAGQPLKVYFYGAGCSAPNRIEEIQKAFYHVLPQAGLEVHHDMLGAARALCGHEEGIACILGTGANSCWFDGQEIQMNVPSLGYILGDEGSGTELGKRFLREYLRSSFSTELTGKIDKRLKTSIGEVQDKVYRGEMPNQYMASFTKIIFDYRKYPAIYRLIYECFSDFFEKVITRYPDYQQKPVHFTGSVAFYFSDFLRQVAHDNGVTVRNILETPIAGLALYHKKSI